jgi:hypothetical protein
VQQYGKLIAEHSASSHLGSMLAFHRARIIQTNSKILQIGSYTLVFIVTTVFLCWVGLLLKQKIPHFPTAIEIGNQIAKMLSETTSKPAQITIPPPPQNKPVGQETKLKPDDTKPNSASTAHTTQDNLPPNLGSRQGAGITASGTAVVGRAAEVVDESGKPLPGAEILLVWSNGTHLQSITGDNGLAIFDSFPPTKEAPSVFCARDGFSHYYGRDHDFNQHLVIRMTRSSNGGSVIFVEGTGFIPGLDGRLNPILDAQDRTYIYADNIAVEGGKRQPVNFTTGRPFQAEDVQGNSFEITVVIIIGRSSLIEYRRIFH